MIATQRKALSAMLTVFLVSLKCKRQSYHKETKTVKEHNIITTNIVEDRHSLKLGGRHVSPYENGIFTTEKQVGSVAKCDTGWGKTQITPEALEQKIEVTETDIDLY